MRSVRSAAAGAARRVGRLLLDEGDRIPSSSMSSLPRIARAKVRMMQLWKAAPLTRPVFFTLRPTPGCRLLAHTESLRIDVVTMNYVLQGDLFPVNFRGRVTVDVGAHKGYFGALAMLEGAAAVYSFEPESSNFEAMRRANITGNDPSNWSRRKLAVGAVDGEVVLHVSSESWAHSVHEPASGNVLHAERVPMVAFSGVLTEVSAKHPNASVLLKLNVEGAAGDCLLSVPPSALSVFDELLIDLEANTPQRLDDITHHIGAAGFDFVTERDRVYRFARSPNLR